MNKTHLHHILNQYIARYDELNNEYNNEGYKWDAEECFKKNWNIDAVDFKTMFKDAFKEMSNLIDNATVQPVGGITMLLNYPDEIPFVRECFRELFSEDGGNLDTRQTRITNFMEKINSHIEKYAKGSWKYPQKMNTVIYYLNLWKPDENYIYKSTEATEWANCIEYGDDFGSGSTFRLKKYYAMRDELLEELKKNDTIMQLYNERMASIKNFHDQGHILVYDIIYCSKCYSLYQSIPTLKKLSTKQRILLAETTEMREKLSDKLNIIQAELEKLSCNPAHPDIVGEHVKHKTWGSGTIVSCDNGVMEIKFNIGIKNSSILTVSTNTSF